MTGVDSTVVGGVGEEEADDSGDVLLLLLDEADEHEEEEQHVAVHERGGDGLGAILVWVKSARPVFSSLSASFCMRNLVRFSIVASDSFFFYSKK